MLKLCAMLGMTMYSYSEWSDQIHWFTLHLSLTIEVALGIQWTAKTTGLVQTGSEGKNERKYT